MRILHVNDIANVGTILVQGLVGAGQEAEFYPLNRPGSGLSLPIKMLLSPLRFLEYARLNSYIKSNSFNIVHIHFASQGIAGVLGRYPFFLHIHGSDVHRNLQVPILAQITQLAIRGAEFVFYSTPNLESFVRPLREDAVYLPNPVMPYRESQGTVQVHRGGVRILLFMRLDPIKISDEFLHPLADLAKRTDIEVHAIRWGTMVEKVEKEYSSIRLISMIPHFEIYDLLSNYDIVIGQMNLGILSLSELEAMLAGKPVIVNFDYPGAYAEPPPILHAKTVEEFMANLEGLILHPEKRKELGSLGRRWVERNHDLETLSRTLLGFYRKAIDSRR